MKKLLIAAVAVFSGLLGANAAVYLKANATGSGDGSSWANACTTLSEAYTQLQALEDTEEASTLYVAQGIYYTDEMTAVPFGALRIYGGYRAESNDDMERDIEEYPTIFAGIPSKYRNACWARITPKLNSYSAPNYVVTEEPLIKDGKVNLIPAVGEYDAFCYNNCDSFTSVKPIVFQDGTGGIVSGIQFVGYKRDDQGTCIRIDVGSKKNAGKVVVENCTFAAMAAQTGVIGVRPNVVVDLQVKNCLFYGIKHQASGGCCIYYVGTATGSVEDCTFIGCHKNDGYLMGPIITTATALISVKRCTFTHCFTANGTGNGITALIYQGYG